MCLILLEITTFNKIHHPLLHTQDLVMVKIVKGTTVEREVCSPSYWKEFSHEFVYFVLQLRNDSVNSLNLGSCMWMDAQDGIWIFGGGFVDASRYQHTNRTHHTPHSHTAHTHINKYTHANTRAQTHSDSPRQQIFGICFSWFFSSPFSML